MALLHRPDPDEPAPLAPLVGRRPERGAAPAAKDVINDVRTLVKAEIDVAKAEATTAIKEKAIGAGYFIVALIMLWLIFQTLWIFIGFLLALVMPAWGAVGVVMLIMILITTVLVLLGVNEMKKDASMSKTKASIEQSKVSVTTAKDSFKANVEEGIAEATATTKTAFSDLVNQFRGVTYENFDDVEYDVPRSDGDTLIDDPDTEA